MDPEVLRQRAAARRRLEEEQRQRKLDDAVAARKAEEERKIAEREAAQKAAEAEKAEALQGDKRPKRLRSRITTCAMTGTVPPMKKAAGKMSSPAITSLVTRSHGVLPSVA